ncbi:MAG: DUF4383 domain-containing protein [Gemmatimonadaceae bacterium]|nr:DUF4383 domain-containing protein [Gemmatimonadaceae bacterium]
MTTTIQKVAMIFGIGFILTAISGFIVPGGMGMESDPAMAGKALGLFPVNLLHNVVHLLFGIWGLAASRSFSGSVAYTKIAGVIYAVLIVAGFFAPTGLGLIPLGGNDPWLHIALALPLLFFGFTAKADTVTTTTTV